MTLWHENILQNDFMTWKWFLKMILDAENALQNDFVTWKWFLKMILRIHFESKERQRFMNLIAERKEKLQEPN